MNNITLRSGHSIPQLGLGTWRLSGSTCSETVARAIGFGYRHLDTAFGYSNHREVGEGIRRSGIDRQELFVTTKIPLGKETRKDVLEQGTRLQHELGMPYVDLLLIHWPDRTVEFSETLGALGELVDDGTTRSIGVSNFNADLVTEADRVSPKPIVTNQVEFHPFLYQRELQQACEERGIAITAYSPVAQGEVMKDTRLIAIGEHHGVSPAEVAIAWLLSKGIIVIPKATSDSHLKGNLAAASLKLDSSELGEMDRFDEHRRLVDGPWKHYPLE
jgi:2,5-diketo-D-gluconate reductase B